MSDMGYGDVVAVLRAIVARQEMSMSQLAAYLGLSRSHLSLILAGKRRPGLRLLRAAANRLPEVRLVLREGADEARGERRTFSE